jgi:3-oxoacyl-(acyl-carrier-protein) synthase
VEAIVCLLSLAKQEIPPNGSGAEYDPDLPDIDLVTDVRSTAGMSIAMSSSLGFGGHNAAVVFERSAS